MKNKTKGVVIYVKGGCVEVITAPSVTVHVIDFDVLDGEDCHDKCSKANKRHLHQVYKDNMIV